MIPILLKYVKNNSFETPALPFIDSYFFYGM